MTRVVEYLQSEYRNGEILHYIASRIPSGNLPTGWIEEGLTMKGIVGQLRDKGNQEHLVIPLDRFVRLVRDIDMDTPSSILLAGEKGLHKPKIVSIASNNIVANSMMALCFWTKEASLDDTMDNILGEILRVSQEHEEDESVMDYTEELRKDFHDGLVSSFLTLKIPKGKIKISEWANPRKNAKYVVDSENFQQKSYSLVDICGKWLPNLALFKGFKNGVASLIFQNPDRTYLCMWDSSQGFASFASIVDDTLRRNPRKYLRSLWTSQSDLAGSITTPAVIVEKTPSPTKRVPDSKTSSIKAEQTAVSGQITQLSDRLTAIPVAEIERRLQKLENAVSIGSEEGQASTILMKRLNETTILLEGLSKRLHKLEKRLERIGISPE